MAAILVNQCKPLMLDQRLIAPPMDDAELLLFTGATIPTVTTVLGDLTELVAVGYTRVELSGWTPAVLRADNHAFSSADECVFSNTDVANWPEVTGWAWYSPGDGVLIMAGRFSVPWILPPGQDYPTTPTHTLTGE